MFFFTSAGTVLADIVGGFAASMVIEVSDLHLAKAEVPMVSTPEPMVIEVRDEYWKQSLPMLFTELGTTKVFSTVPSNADTSNEVMVFGRVTDVRSEL